MALDQDLLSSLGLEIAKRKYYNAAKVESVIEDFERRAAALGEENAALRARVESMSFAKEEIGDAILSAKTIAQQLLSEAQTEADGILAAARAEAGRLVSEAEEKRAALLSEAERREQEAIRRVENAYLQLRGQYAAAIGTLDQDWQRFLCSLDDESAQKAEPPLPEDLAERLGEIAQSLDEISAKDDEQGT